MRYIIIPLLIILYIIWSYRSIQFFRNEDYYDNRLNTSIIWLIITVILSIILIISYLLSFIIYNW